jgi:hypothetical protein
MMLHTACGGGADDSGGGGAFPLSCKDGEFKIEGTIAGQAVVLHGSSAGGGYWRINPAGFSSQASSLAIDPARTSLDLEWKDDFLKDTFPATGTLLMGTADPLPGKEYCVGPGTQVDFTRDDMRFVLKGLTEGPGCQTPVPGDLVGCWL